MRNGNSNLAVLLASIVAAAGVLVADTISPPCIHKTGFLEGFVLPASATWQTIHSQTVTLVEDSDVALQTLIQFMDHGSFAGGTLIEYRNTVDGVPVDLEFRHLVPEFVKDSHVIRAIAPGVGSGDRTSSLEARSASLVYLHLVYFNPLVVPRSTVVG
jgi:hypothetical protein